MGLLTTRVEPWIIRKNPSTPPQQWEATNTNRACQEYELITHALFVSHMGITPMISQRSFAIKTLQKQSTNQIHPYPRAIPPLCSCPPLQKKTVIFHNGIPTPIERIKQAHRISLSHLLVPVAFMQKELEMHKVESLTSPPIGERKYLQDLTFSPRDLHHIF